MFITYNASAGSGKTTNLVAEYLSICMDNPTRFKNILAITFTNNATAEMKSRIVDTLYHFAFDPLESLQGSEKAICKMVKVKCPTLSDAEMQTKSKELLSHILYDYPNFSISTIDSFFQRLIRAFAFELNINLDFSVVVQLDDYYTQTVDILLNKISKDHASLTRSVLNLLDSQLDEKGKWQLENELVRTLATIYREDTYFPMQKLSEVENLNDIITELFNTKKELLKYLKTEAQVGCNLIKNTGLSAVDFFQVNKGIYTWFNRVLTNPSSAQSDGFVVKAIEKECFTSPKAPRSLSQSEYEDLKAQYLKVKEAQKNYARLAAFVKNIHALSLLFELKSIMDEIKLRDNLFYLSETNYKVYNEIKDEETPYIYEKLGNKYSYFFIDEFQDTSNLQWENMLPLIRNALASGGKSILFGDVKQAIYRFRGGDSQLLHAVTTDEDYQKKIAPMDTSFEIEPLQTNYRTDGYVVNFNNKFFSYLKILDKFSTLAKGYYEEVEQTIAEGREKKGFVSIQFKSPDAGEDYLTQSVLEAVQDARNRNFRLRDIAILSRGNEISNALGEFLTKNEIPVISSNSLLLKSSDKINLMISVLRFLVDENDALSICIVGNYILKQHQQENDSLSEVLDMIIPKQKVTETDKKENHDPTETQRENNFLKFLNDRGFTINPYELIQQPLYSLVSKLMTIFHLEETDAFVSAFLENVLTYSQSSNGELSSFLDWWSQNEEKLSISMPDGIDAITVMTIHSSKGLQFPVVILPCTQYKEGKTKTTFWYENPNYLQSDDALKLPFVQLNNNDELSSIGLGDYVEEEKNLTAIDNLNILYVAHTRPKNALYIITGKPQSEGGRGNYNLFLDQFVQRNLQPTHQDEQETSQLFQQNEEMLNFIQDENNPLHFWYGDIDFKVTSNESEQNQGSQNEISRFYTTDFALPQLAFQGNMVERNRGNAVHDFLSKLKAFPKNETELDNMNFEGNPFCSDIKAALSTIMERPDFYRLFGDEAQVLNEVSILTQDGELKRPDRVVIYSDKVFVIDYKTGSPAPKYQNQINEYVSLLEGLGYQNVEGILLYM